MEIRAFEQPISKLNVKADLKYLRPVLEFVRFFAVCEGLPEKTARLLEVAVEEACVNVIKHAYGPDENGYFDVSVSRRSHQLVISIEDRGLPADMEALEKNEKNSLGVMLMKSIADEVVFQNLGEHGKRVKIIKNLPLEHEPVEDKVALETAPAAVSDGGAAGAARSAAGTPMRLPVIRFMETGEALKLSRCIYHVYGYTYGTAFYYPEKIAEMINSKLLKSVVAVNDDGDIVAHLGLKFPYPGARIAESAQAAVMPQYRGMRIFEKMKEFSARYAAENGLYGLYSEAVTIHPYTQKGNVSLGAKETGLILAFIPEIVNFRKIQKGGEKSQRQAAMLFYLKTGEGPARSIYAPPRHTEMMQRIYEHNGLVREFIAPAGAPVCAQSVLDVSFNAYLNAAIIVINSVGHDFGAAMKNYQRELCEKRTDCIYAYIPLADPGAPAACEALEKLKFSFAGIIPEYFSGDCAVYHFLNNVPVEPERICAVSDFAKTLLKYIINEYDGSKNL